MRGWSLCPAGQCPSAGPQLVGPGATARPSTDLEVGIKHGLAHALLVGNLELALQRSKARDIVPAGEGGRPAGMQQSVAELWQRCSARRKLHNLSWQPAWVLQQRPLLPPARCSLPSPEEPSVAWGPALGFSYLASSLT